MEENNEKTLYLNVCCRVSIKSRALENLNIYVSHFLDEAPVTNLSKYLFLYQFAKQ